MDKLVHQSSGRASWRAARRRATPGNGGRDGQAARRLHLFNYFKSQV
ncbi:MAG: hypothetical protein IPK34_00340 [Ramlibacter sp.]|nr:hypothetical protein [Ramlibacter sp.]